MAEKSFSDIFEKWEKLQSKTKKDIMKKALDLYAPDNSVMKEKETDKEKKLYERIKRKIRPQATLDLHGYTSTEAERLLAQFIKRAYEKRYLQILIIHGKGLHSNREPILKKLVYKYLQDSPYIGKILQAPRELGGSGAVCAFIRHRSL
ncbi:Smr/MutS family protein [Spirochaetia bacterium 38H-sp]|uniref:Smr/MutS family protein n=1 Tax=Rarispira pelagica TaxID=3141764 RepID=A0ABU9UE11_9SPIR